MSDMIEDYRSAAFEDISVLVVDDEPIMLQLVERILQDMGFKDIQAIQEPKTARAILYEGEKIGNPVDLVICDWMMPDLSGIELLRSVRERGLTMPFVMLTGKTTADAVAEAHELAVDAYIAKPFEADDVRIKIASIARRILNTRR